MSKPYFGRKRPIVDWLLTRGASVPLLRLGFFFVNSLRKLRHLLRSRWAWYLLPLGFAPDISRGTLVSTLRRQFILTTVKGGGFGELRYLDIALNGRALCL